MDSLLSVADGPVEPEDYYLDLDAGADAGVEDFDFKLDGAYGDETQGISVEADPGSAAKTTADFEIGYEDEEAAAPTEGATKAAEAEHDAKQDLDAEYQDEIDYEDDEPETNAAVADSEVTGPGSPGAGQEAVVHEHDEAQVLDHPIMNDGFDEPDGEDMGPFDVGADASADATDDASAHRSQPDHNQTPASGLGDLRDTSADVSSASLASSMPEITVHYNHGRYSLVGAPSDDPDSYFFSDSKDLDGSLSQLLSSIRAVISDEVSPGDELVVRIDGLDLEFGEKSNPKFLNRTFQEIVSCFSALFNDSENEAQELELDLLLRRDCEMRFVELLEEAGLADEPSDISTGFGGVDDDGLANEDVSVDDYPQEFDIGEGLVNAIADGDPSEAAEQDQKAMTSQADSNNGEETLSGALDLQTNLNEIDSAELTQFEPGNEMNFEEEYLEVHSEVTNGEVNEETNEEKGEACALADVDDAGDLDEVFKADEDFDGPELAIDITEQPIIGQGVDAWSGGQAEMDTGEVGDTGMPEPTLHGNDHSFFSPETPNPSTTLNPPGHSFLDGPEDLIDYSSDEEMPRSLPHQSGKRKQASPLVHTPSKKQKMDAEQWVADSSTAEHHQSKAEASTPAPVPSGKSAAAPLSLEVHQARETINLAAD
ncbi:hypothetical protein B0T16DRAFT_458288 [Cercophora newfieldiana]|uniref:Uncharacterized protein n=1 Tax=Cercophora newfieldiana TaxID=92897 RepID=A0AA39Y7D1_9PEZI|nr:hypothetical protein B0T16DRAFT_458288 [Cercophora newfieldiana]